MQKIQLLLLLASLIAFSPFLTIKCYAKVVSCEGFVQANGIQVDLSRIQAKLFTTQGNLKYETECNPQNGYFLIPIYNKGKYMIRLSTPDGWIFDPEYREINIIDDSEGCGEDINFNLSGFEISGTVLNDDGSLQLGLYNSNGKLIRQTRASRDGRYKFGAKPGKYLISTMSDSAQCVRKGSVPIEVKDDSVRVLPDIEIVGHNLVVNTLDEDSSSISGVEVLLQSEERVEFENLPLNAKVPIERQEAGSWFYALETDANGSVFNCLPPAKYVLSATKREPNVEIVFERKNFKMESKAANVALQANAFNVHGRVILDTKPIHSVVLLDGQMASTTNNDGTFILRGLKPAKHSIRAEKEHFEFVNREIQISSRFDQKITLEPTKVAICGSVFPADGSISFDVLSENGVKIESFQPDGQGQFCRMLSPAKYRILPLPPISYTPKEVTVDARGGPVLDLRFTQFKAKLSGRVECFGQCSRDVSLELWKDGDLIAQSKILPTGEFHFSDVSPSKYLLKISEMQGIWWGREELAVEVTDKDLTGLHFKQSGFKLEVRSTHAAKMVYSSPENKSKQVHVDLAAGSTIIMLPKSGTYAFSIDSCHEFDIDGGADQLHFSIPSTKPLLLTAANTRITISIQVTGKDPSLGLILNDKLTETDIPPHDRSIADGMHNFVFLLSHSYLNKELVAVPKSDRHLFVPTSISIRFDGNCQKGDVVFKAQMGQFIEGKIVPAVSSVAVKAQHKTDPNMVLNTEAGADGKYKIGPVWSVHNFEVDLVKEGYEFQRDATNPFYFTSTKLSQLLIQFVDVESKAPLADVLVSVSGDRPSSFRSNTVTDNSGQLNFVGLAPGNYFVRPILQEYKFNSSSFSVVVSEGQTQELILEAKRYAYSVYGKVSTIGSKALKSPVHIEATSAACENHQEEAVVDPRTDEFRISAIKPECDYQVTLKSEDGTALKAFPPLIDLKTGNRDKHDVNFVVLPNDLPDATLVGELDLGSIPFPNSFRIILSENGNVLQEQIVHSPSSIFFFTLPGYNKHYSVGIDRNEAKRIKIKPVATDFFVDSSFNFVKLLARPEQRPSDVDVLRANYLGLALIMLITFGFLNQSKTRMFLDYVSVLIRSLLQKNRAADGSGADQEAMRRKKLKKT